MRVMLGPSFAMPGFVGVRPMAGILVDIELVVQQHPTAHTYPYLKGLGQMDQDEFLNS